MASQAPASVPPVTGGDAGGSSDSARAASQVTASAAGGECRCPASYYAISHLHTALIRLLVVESFYNATRLSLTGPWSDYVFGLYLHTLEQRARRPRTQLARVAGSHRLLQMHKVGFPRSSYSLQVQTATPRPGQCPPACLFLRARKLTPALFCFLPRRHTALRSGMTC